MLLYVPDYLLTIETELCSVDLDTNTMNLFEGKQSGIIFSSGCDIICLFSWEACFVSCKVHICFALG